MLACIIAFAGDTRKIEFMACFLRQLGYKHALRSTVTFAEWMHTVKLNHKCGGAIGKFLTAKAAQIIFIAHFAGYAFESIGYQRALHKRPYAEIRAQD